jgi:hypothetical protein
VTASPLSRRRSSSRRRPVSAAWKTVAALVLVASFVLHDGLMAGLPLVQRAQHHAVDGNGDGDNGSHSGDCRATQAVAPKWHWRVLPSLPPGMSPQFPPLPEAAAAISVPAPAEAGWRVLPRAMLQVWRE